MKQNIIKKYEDFARSVYRILKEMHFLRAYLEKLIKINKTVSYYDLFYIKLFLLIFFPHDN